MSITTTGKNTVEKAVQKFLENMRAIIETWREKIEADRKGKQFIKKNEKYLVVMIFGVVKAGKSSLGNFLPERNFSMRHSITTIKKFLSQFLK